MSNLIPLICRGAVCGGLTGTAFGGLVSQGDAKSTAKAAITGVIQGVALGAITYFGGQVALLGAMVGIVCLCSTPAVVLAVSDLQQFNLNMFLASCAGGALFSFFTLLG